ncbi:MAG: hypothetical protein ABGW69_00790 [Nanoarchaeota archaeon]
MIPQFSKLKRKSEIFFNYKITIAVFTLFLGIFGLVNASLITKGLEITNNNNFPLVNYTLVYKVNTNSYIKVLGSNGQPLDFCYYHNNTLSCDNIPSDYIVIRVPFVPAYSSYKLFIVSSNINYASSDPKKVVPIYVDYKNYFPDINKYSFIESNGYYCYNTTYRTRGKNYLYIRNAINYKYSAPIYKIFFNAELLDRTIRYFSIYSYFNATYFNAGYVGISYYYFYGQGQGVFNFSTSGSYLKFPLSATHPKVVTTWRHPSLGYIYDLKLYPSGGSSLNQGFCLKGLIGFRFYDNVNINEFYPATIYYTFSNPICYIVKNNYQYYLTNCSNLPINQDLLIINPNDDITLRIYNFSFNLLQNPTVTIALNKLDEGYGYVKFIAAINNASFNYALANIPIISEPNKGLINVTKNNLSYHVEKYYLTFKFNETDPVFVAKFPNNESSLFDNLISKIKTFIYNLI